MPRFLARLLGQPKPSFDPKPRPRQRAADRQKMLDTTRQLRFELGLPWRI